MIAKKKNVDDFDEFIEYWEKENYYLFEFYSNEENNMRLITYWKNSGITFDKENINIAIDTIKSGSISQLYLLQKLK